MTQFQIDNIERAGELITTTQEAWERACEYKSWLTKNCDHKTPDGELHLSPESYSPHCHCLICLKPVHRPQKEGR